MNHTYRQSNSGAVIFTLNERRQCTDSLPEPLRQSCGIRPSEVTDLGRGLADRRLLQAEHEEVEPVC